jgi:hypothetical protein
MTRKRATILVLVLAAWMLLVSGFVLAIGWKSPVHRAVLGMAWGLIILWVGVCGLTMWRWRDLWRRLAARVPLPWGLKFVLGCVMLMMVEEAVTTLMTNCAPLFGVKVGQAYITASANYFDVVLYHSVVAISPMFIGWAVMLWRWRFSPFAVFILFGLTGFLAEGLTFGLSPGSLAFWVFVYGLMVWLPAYCVPAERSAREPRWWAYPLAVAIPFLFLPLMAVLAPWLWLTPKHPPIHFPPIQ